MACEVQQQAPRQCTTRLLHSRLTQLRCPPPQVCNHPYMFSDAEPDFDGESTGEDIVTASGKMQVCT